MDCVSLDSPSYFVCFCNNRHCRFTGARNIRKTILDNFVTVYKLRTIPAGAVVRAWPLPFTVWKEDKDADGGYKVARTFESDPTADQIERALQVIARSCILQCTQYFARRKVTV